jgi:hypothetical protein
VPIFAFNVNSPTQTADGGAVMWSIGPISGASTANLTMPPAPLLSYALTATAGTDTPIPGIPSSASILGIQLNVALYASGANVARDTTIQLLKGGTPVANRATNSLLGTTDITLVYGGATDLWGTTWTPSDILNIDWYVQVTGTGTAGNIYVDGVGILVYTTGIYGANRIIPPYGFQGVTNGIH